MRRAPWLASCFAALLLAGCASEPLEMRLDAPAAGGRLFPGLETQEVPRYRYVGQLLGETNFRPKDGSQRNAARRLFSIITGLDEGPYKPVQLVRPQTGLVDPAGRVLVTDVGRNAIFVFDEAGGRMDLWEKASRSQRFESPIAIALGRGGQLLVTDSDLGRVFRLGPDGTPLGEFGGPVLQRPTGIARDAQRGRVFVADSHAHDIKVFDDDGNLVATWGRRGEGPGEFNYPTHLAFSDGLLIVSDSMNARVQGLDAEGKPVLRFGQRGLYVGNLVRPKGVASDDEGNLYVVESMYDTLLVYDRAGRLLMSLGGTNGDAGNFHLPAGVWVDARNRVYVADMFNSRVAVFQFLGGN